MTTKLSRRGLVGGSALSAALTLPGLRRARAQQPTVRIGLLTDMSGPSADICGVGSEAGVRLAVQDFQAANPGFGAAIEVIVGDFQSKADLAVGIARSWIDQRNVDAIIGLPLSAAALGVNTMLVQNDKVGLLTEAGASNLTGADCGPNHVQWTYDTYQVCAPAVNALVPAGDDTWFFLTADFALGHSLVADTTAFIQKAGGKVVGEARFPYTNSDFASQLLSAQSSKAKVVALASPGDPVALCIKQAAEFGLVTGGQKLALLIALINNIHGVGLQAAQGLYVSEAFYWDLNEGTRAFSKRFGPMAKGAMPNMVQAGDYSATLHYLKTLASMGVAKAKASGRATIAAMKALPTDDALFGRGYVRKDGRNIHPMHLFQVKAPAESKGAWDYYKLVKTISGDDSTRPLEAGGCKVAM